MANRSYLYACNEIPGASDTPEQNLIGISECNYAVPLAYKILLSANPQACRSRIWNSDENIAIVSEFDAGLKALTHFLNRITLKDSRPQIEASINFLNKSENNATYFLLECGEIYDMQDVPLGMQNSVLLKNIAELDGTMQSALNKINPLPTNQGLKKRFKFFDRSSKDQNASAESMQALAELGLNNWSNHLYFDFSQ